jgi:hypothetical protein
LVDGEREEGEEGEEGRKEEWRKEEGRKEEGRKKEGVARVRRKTSPVRDVILVEGKFAGIFRSAVGT